MEYQPLSVLLDSLTRDNHIHICIEDLSGLLAQPGLELPFSMQIHSRPFCDAAKGTPAGLKLCMTCKLLASKRAVTGRRPFSGLCPYGVYELVYPVLLDGTVCCILYVGNLISDPSAADRRRRKAARLTKIDHLALAAALPETEQAAAPDRCLTLARLVESYLLLVCRQIGFKPQSGSHWAVAGIRREIEAHYAAPLTLSSMARLFFLNEKYLGRLFKSQTGITFHAYLSQVRLDQAARLLRNTGRSVTAVALDCGFQNVTYFNRMFRRRYGCTPSGYRRLRENERP